jgi:hypothetical protein
MCCSALPAEMVSQVTDVLDIERDRDRDRQVRDISRNCSMPLPLGMEKHLSFHYFFMQHFPQQAIRTHLGDVQPGVL